MDHSLEIYNEEQHASILYAAMLEDVDISPMVGGAERYIHFGATKSGYGPSAIVDVAGTEYMAEPHVTWFPWTTAGNRIVNFKWGMEYFSKDRQVMLTVEKKQKEFYDHFVKRGLLRKVGYLDNLPIVDEIHMYQYIKGEDDE